MKRPNLLPEDEIQKYLSDLPYWRQEGNSIVREIVAEDFVSAIGIVNSIAIIAESLDHHPDILIYGWNKIRITSSTHDRGGLTELDFQLAKKIENLKIIQKGDL
ncbi:MAG: 4a-hydroxytetrahydrobiopterin dehydratase [Ignavibacteria bacterium]|nr:4a-hydroxytetrahydrobiopterin dehydratase [Ignavibacteria bacterium]